MAIGIGRGDEVIVPSFTFFASVSCIASLTTGLNFSSALTLSWTNVRRVRTIYSVMLAYWATEPWLRPFASHDYRF